MLRFWLNLSRSNSCRFDLLPPTFLHYTFKQHRWFWVNNNNRLSIRSKFKFQCRVGAFQSYVHMVIRRRGSVPFLDHCRCDFFYSCKRYPLESLNVCHGPWSRPVDEISFYIRNRNTWKSACHYRRVDWKKSFPHFHARRVWEPVSVVPLQNSSYPFNRMSACWMSPQVHKK